MLIRISLSVVVCLFIPACDHIGSPTTHNLSIKKIVNAGSVRNSFYTNGLLRFSIQVPKNWKLHKNKFIAHQPQKNLAHKHGQVYSDKITEYASVLFFLSKAESSNDNVNSASLLAVVEAITDTKLTLKTYHNSLVQLMQSGRVKYKISARKANVEINDHQFSQLVFESDLSGIRRHHIVYSTAFPNHIVSFIGTYTTTDQRQILLDSIKQFSSLPTVKK